MILLLYQLSYTATRAVPTSYDVVGGRYKSTVPAFTPGTNRSEGTCACT
jgi:hypothetical protein